MTLNSRRVPSWSGSVVIDASGNIVCWPNSTPKLYNGAADARFSLAPGERLAPITFQVAAFTVVRGPELEQPMSIAPRLAALSPLRPGTEAHLSGTHRAILDALKRAHGPVGIATLVEQLGGPYGRISVALGILVRRGFVQRERRGQYRRAA